MNLKKIIIFYPSFERGGVELILINLIKYFLKKKIKIILFSANFKEHKIISNNLFELKKFENKKKNFIPKRVSTAINASKALIDELKKSDVKNTVVFSLQSSSLSIFLSKIFKFKVVVRNAEDPIYSTIYAEKKLFAILVLIFKFLTYNFADGIITNSIGSKKSIKKLIFFKKKVRHIYNPYLSRIIKKTNFKKNDYILSIGRLTKQKDFENLIRSFKILQKEIKNYKLIIIGDGELKKKLYKVTQELGLNKKILFLGWTKNLDKYYKKSKIFVLNSLYEGLGNVVIDAANYELPIITTNCKSGPPEIIDNGRGGFLVPLKSPLALSEKIKFVINNNQVAKSKSLYAKKRINRFLCEKNSHIYLNFLENKLNDR
ncbi:glycosyltransferase [Candidatus Pelagibacter sp. Uisw_113]|uniref:glycosyltransferase n=1 Tax=Candidatus Pelagibacter sp. Uisw_113 TaxID=3230994 RepID=UPI0039EA48A0